MTSVLLWKPACRSSSRTSPIPADRQAELGGTRGRSTGWHQPGPRASYLGPCARWLCTGRPGLPGQPACLERSGGPERGKGEGHVAAVGRRWRVQRGGLCQLLPITLMAVTEAGGSLEPPTLRQRLLMPAAPIRPRTAPILLHTAPYCPTLPHRLPPALALGGRAVASSQGSSPCHSLHCQISHKRPRIGAGSARSGGGRERRRRGRKA